MYYSMFWYVCKSNGFVFFFFQAEDGIRDLIVTGVQTCALPISQQDVADAVGRDRSTVANALRLLKLPAAVLALLHEGGLSVGHARALLALEDTRVATSLAKEAVDLGLSGREVEDRVRGGRAPVPRPRL